VHNHRLPFKIVEAISYKPEGRGLNSRRFRWNFVLIESFRPQYMALGRLTLFSGISREWWKNK
jgi:hypothetical protein